VKLEVNRGRWNARLYDDAWIKWVESASEAPVHFWLLTGEQFIYCGAARKSP
jgi:hypothetical protein